jgi:isopentenyldiphosphate isomerase
MLHSTEEILPVVNENGEVIGKAPREKFHFNQKEKLLHPVVHLHVINSNGQVFLQLRPANKKVQPGKWDTAVGGHISYGEDVKTALERESMEEIGIQSAGAELVTRYIWETDIEKELVYLFILKTDILPEINKNELEDGRFRDPSDIDKKLESEDFTPNFIYEFQILRQKAVI